MCRENKRVLKTQICVTHPQCVKNTVMWIMTPCSEVDLYGRCVGTLAGCTASHARGRCRLYRFLWSMGTGEPQKANLVLALKAGQVRRCGCAIFWNMAAGSSFIEVAMALRCARPCPLDPNVRPFFRLYQPVANQMSLGKQTQVHWVRCCLPFRCVLRLLYQLPS